MHLFRKSIRKAVCEVNLITWCFSKIVGKRHLVVVTYIVWVKSWSSYMMGPTVWYFFTSTMPLIVLTFTSNTNLHTSTVKRRWLREVANIEFDFLVEHSCAFILNTEVEPLMVTSCICIHSHKQIIFVFLGLYYHV